MSRFDLNQLKNKRIVILGLGIENLALVKFLVKHKVSCGITICDARKNIFVGTQNFAFLRKYKNIKWQLGKNYDKNLKDFDIIFRSPGYPLFKPNLVKARKAGVEISSPMKLFFALCPTKNIIGVTGTKGKGTVASLIVHILKKAGKRVWLGGNIGVAPFEFIDKIKKNDWVVLELSSFQLEDMDVSPHIAVITNFYKEHLASADPNNPNYHKSLRDYWNAKLNIIRWQKKGDKAIINKKLEIRNCPPAQTGKFGNGKKIFFTKLDLLSKLVGEHNKENVAAAVEVAKIAGVKDGTTKKSVAFFKGLEHRLELVGTKRVVTNVGLKRRTTNSAHANDGAHANKKMKGVKYYNDSFATTPESAIIAIKAFTSPVILLAGGAEKGSDFNKLARVIKKKVKYVVLLDGKATLRFKKELLKIGYPKNKVVLANSMKTALKLVSKRVIPSDIVLLSPACASFGMFKNYKERGDLFKKEVKKIN